MSNMLPKGAIAWVVPGIILLLGCTAQNPVAAAAQPARLGSSPKQALSVSTPVAVIAANPQGKVVLQRDLPGLLTNPKYQLFSDMSLTQLASLSCGKLTSAKLAQVQADLAALPPAKDAEQ